MPVVKGGVWTNIEDEILKASVSKYGLNQWARVSSLLARKTPKQCKARWSEWLDPGIRKIEWSREEDEKLLHLAKLMPTQWRTIAPIVGRTATQCLERYQKLLDEAEARENNEFGLGGPDGAETAAPSADDVRRLRPGELDPDPESKPARPDTIDMDEDEKEMLSEARARLANTQGKKAKRKARERQLEESRRMAVLQKRRELKTAGINIKVSSRFFDTQEEQTANEEARESFDPRKQQLANKRKSDAADVDGQETKRRKAEKNSGAAAYAAAAKAGQLQRIREAEQSSKRRSLVLPAPQVSESELEDIVKMGISGDRAMDGDESSRGLISNYAHVTSATPLRTPRAPQGEDRIANELRDAKARTETQSALFGADNTPMHDQSATTGFEGAAPSQQTLATPNPLATPRPNGAVGATPLRTPRDGFNLNAADMQLVGQTPRDIRLAEKSSRSTLRSKLAALPRPKEMDFELELPEEQQETAVSAAQLQEDAALRDRRNAELAEAAALRELKQQTQVVQRGLPRPKVIDVNAMTKHARSITDPAERLIEEELITLLANDARNFGGAKVQGSALPVREYSEEVMQRAHMEVVMAMGDPSARAEFGQAFEQEWTQAHAGKVLPGLAAYADDDEWDEEQLLTETFDKLQDRISASASKGAALEKKLAKHHGGYIERNKKLRQKIVDAAALLAKTKIDVDVARAAQVAENAALTGRLEQLRDEVALVTRREREAQDVYRERKDEFQSLR
ncbi:hypothetical protein AMS68_004514 [Peltaster fructicola]|uniref:Pre-mRNA-splicing factor cef1 n=1 Tax=Peltaster fructicola TaxID=286661 RepID=A0A6H0XW54_9PEZI|nr:hypothetical protein AMS68_004514 [Peltaster fructicola]